MIKTYDNLLATENAAHISQQLLIQSEQYKKLSENIAQTERLRHDMKHHFITLKGYVEHKDLEGASGYLDTCIQKELPKEEISLCEKQSVDMIVRYYIALAREIGVQVKASIQLPNSFNVSDTDLCVIFGNLIENAVESCERQQEGKKFISINAKIINEYILALNVTNSYDGVITKSGDNFISSKQNRIGIGTMSVKNIIEKNGGSYKFSFENNVFKVLVLLGS